MLRVEDLRPVVQDVDVAGYRIIGQMQRNGGVNVTPLDEGGERVVDHKQRFAAAVDADICGYRILHPQRPSVRFVVR